MERILILIAEAGGAMAVLYGLFFISFQTTMEALQDLAITKAKKLIADAQLVVPDEEPAQSNAPVEGTPVSEATTTTTMEASVEQYG